MASLIHNNVQKNSSHAPATFNSIASDDFIQSPKDADSNMRAKKKMKHSKLSDFMSSHSITKDSNLSMTNTRIGDKTSNIYGGNYHISDDDYPTFLKLYASEIIQNNQDEYFTEKQLPANGPILVDIDLRYDYSVCDRFHSDEHIEDLKDIYLEELKQMYQFDENTKFPIFIMQKDAVNRVKEKNITKDGIHMIIGIQCDRASQIILRKRVMSKVKDAWGDFPITNDWEDVFDKGITEGHTNWQLFGSKKPHHSEYKITHIYNITYDPCDGEPVTILEPVEKFDIVKNVEKLSARYSKHPSFFYTSDFIKTREQSNVTSGVRSSSPVRQRRPGQEIADMNAYLLKIKTQAELEDAVNDFLDGLLPQEYDIREAYEYTMILPPSYYEVGSYTKWIQVGFALRNINNNLFIAWLSFSAQASNFTFSSTIQMYELWRTFDLKNPNGLTKRSIIHWAKQDAYDRYKDVYNKSIDFYIDQTLKSISLDNFANDKNSRGCGDFDIATVLYQLFKDEYVCASVKGNLWYHLKTHRWVENDSGTTLRKAVSTILRDKYWARAQNMMQQASNLNPPDEDRAKKLQDHANKILDICARLSRTNDKKNIMTEAKELFYDPEIKFFEMLDENPFLLCFKNGVIDFKTKEFRRGRPEDYLSKCTNIDYIKIDPIKHKKIIDEIEDFFHKIFPDQELYDYMWQHLASTLIGTNQNQKFNMYIGEGQNGKSKLVDLMKLALGDYAGIVPLSLITGDRVKVGGLSPEIIKLKGQRYSVMQEPTKGDKVNEGKMKELTGGDMIQARAPFMISAVEFKPQFTLALCSNTMMEIKDTSHGTWRRIRIVEFKSLFCEKPYSDPEKQEIIHQFVVDETIDQKFNDWKEVFMSMLIDIAFTTNGKVNDCPMVLAASNEYRNSQDYFADFIRDVMVTDPNGRVSKTEVVQEFKSWYEANCGRNVPNIKDLRAYMDKRFGKYEVKKAWMGITINYRRNTASDSDDDGNIPNIDVNEL